jgi:CP family cyanate transporter-like MFS transporter
MLILLQVGMGLNFMSPAPLFAVIMSDYDIGRSSVSLLVSATIIFITIALLPGGLLIAKIGSRRALIIAGFLMSAPLLTPLNDSFISLIVLRLVLGLGIAITIPATSAIIMEWFKPNELPLLNGINEAGRALGVSAGVFIAVPIASNIGWEMTLSSFGTIPLIGVLIWLIGGRSNESQAKVEPPFSIRDNIPLMLNRNTLLLALGMVGAFAVFIGFSSWLPTYYNETREMTLEQASSIVAMMPLMAALLNPVSGLIQSKLGRRKPVLVFAGFMMPVFALGSFLLTNQIILTICIMGLGAMFSIFIVAALTIPMELPGVSASRVGIVTAAILTMGNFSGVLSPIFVGSLTDLMGSYIPALSIVALTPLTLVIAGVFLPETGHRGRRITP